MDRRDFMKIIGGVGIAGFLAGCSDKATSLMPLGGRKDDGIVLDDEFATPELALKAPAPAPRLLSNQQAKGLQMVKRDYWGAGAPITSRLNPMTRIECVTIHHEGCPKANWNISPSSVAKDLRQIQVSHRQRLNAGDIGYHFIIDREGRIWEGRSLYYQGAHTRGHNKGNVGIMCLGNFDLQSPSQKQLNSLEQLTTTVISHYGIPTSSVYAHSDLVATRCPGRNLKSNLSMMRTELARI
ncbi:MAG: N-acetylmuramoyl-L-alanine amidase [Planctomycetes bacterium]|nr:N-acetylmuramoyl-L-alanine amidase [Planctomycetota bacterium]